MDFPTHHTAPLETLRRYLTFILLLELLGTAAELVLIGHYEEPWQWVPLVLITAGLFLLGRVTAAPSARTVRVWQALMILFMVSGVAGMGFHWKGKMEFKREADPTLAGWKLFREAMKTLTPPALAPGVMIQMGLLGLACVYSHPALEPVTKDRSRNGGKVE